MIHQIKKCLLGTLFILTTQSIYAVQTCPLLTGSATCLKSVWQIKLNFDHNDWYVMENQLQNKPCHEENQKLSQITYKHVWAINHGLHPMCQYNFEQENKSNSEYDITLSTQTYIIDRYNPLWKYSYTWQWHCNDTRENCTIVPAQK